MSQSNQEPEGPVALGWVRETVGAFSHAPWQISSSLDCAVADRQRDEPIEKNNGMLARPLNLLLLAKSS